MKKYILLLSITVLNLNCYSQIAFEEGYYIDNTNQKIDCLIKNVDWRNNPTKFEFKLSENNDSETAIIDSVKEFGISNILKYVRSTVNIDRSSEAINDLSNQRAPKFIEEELFLKVLVEGEANLYEYIDSNLRRYFYKKEDEPIKQLIFKTYRNIDNSISENNRFRQQLWTDLNCSSFKTNKVEYLGYHKKELIKFFVEYNGCHGSEFTNFELKQERDLFNLTIRPRLNSSSLEVKNTFNNNNDTDFGNKAVFGLGLELEVVLPFNKDKWSLAIEPTYQRFVFEQMTDVGVIGPSTTDVDYTSIEIPFSLRHYFFLNNESKIFINASYIIDLPSGSTIEFREQDGTRINFLEIEPINNFAFGAGYKLYDKYSLEVRYHTSRDLISNDSLWSSDYKTLSFILGYSLF